MPLKFKAIRVRKCERVFFCCLVGWFEWMAILWSIDWELYYDQVHLMLHSMLSNFKLDKAFQLQMSMTFSMCNGEEFSMPYFYNFVLIFLSYWCQNFFYSITFSFKVFPSFVLFFSKKRRKINFSKYKFDRKKSGKINKQSDFLWFSICICYSSCS